MTIILSITVIILAIISMFFIKEAVSFHKKKEVQSVLVVMAFSAFFNFGGLYILSAFLI